MAYTLLIHPKHLITTCLAGAGAGLTWIKAPDRAGHSIESGLIFRPLEEIYDG
jgi:hypothetical protein